MEDINRRRRNFLFLPKLERGLQEVTNATKFEKKCQFCFIIVTFSLLSRLSMLKIGSFSIDDGNGSENVSFKMNSRFFNLCCVYSNLLKMASEGEFRWG